MANLSPSETEGSLSRRAWISRVLVESVLVVGSILLALALDEWNEGQDYQDLATLSLLNFEREIQQNRLRLEDVTPFHVGLRDVLANMDIDDAAVPATTIRNILEGFQPALLVSTIPWQQLEDRIEPFYPKAGRGRRPYPLGVMLRVHCVQLFYNVRIVGNGGRYRCLGIHGL